MLNIGSIGLKELNFAGGIRELRIEDLFDEEFAIVDPSDKY
jgi:hypothetical protein